MAISSAIDFDTVTAVAGYAVEISQEGVKAGNLPQRIHIYGEMSSDVQSTAPVYLNTTSCDAVGKAFGYNSPLYAMARILRPKSGSILGSIPTVFYGIKEAVGSVAFSKEIDITGTATGNKTHYLRINGRTSMDGIPYAFTVNKNDTGAVVAQKMVDAVNAAKGCPIKGSALTATFKGTAGWKGSTSNEVTFSVDTDGDSVGMTYTTGDIVAGAGVGSLATALPLMGDMWATLVVNGLGNTAGVLDSLEDFNGNIVSKTGRYKADVWKPFIAFTGTDKDTLSELETAFGDRGEEMTNCIVSAPNFQNFTFETAATAVYYYGKIAQNAPAEDVYGNKGLNIWSELVPPADMVIGDFEDSDMRDRIVKAGFSTMKITNNKFEIMDLVTTRNVPEQSQTDMDYRWVRNLMVIFNLKYSHKYLADIFVKGKIITSNTNPFPPKNSISPNRWQTILELSYFPPLVDRGLINGYSDLQVGIGETNPNRFEDAFTAYITGIARVQSTNISVSTRVSNTATA